MSFVATAVAGSTALNMGGSIFSGLFGSGAEKRRAAQIREAGDIASRDILKSATNANAIAEDKLGVARGDLSPFRGYGVQAGETLMNMLIGGNPMSPLMASPLFNFQSELGSRNINRELSARGLYGSGAGLETLARFNSQLVAEEGQRFVDRLFNLTNLGANTATSMADMTTKTGWDMADTLFKGGVTAANTRFNAAIGAADATANATKILGGMGKDIFNAAGKGLATLGEYELYKPTLKSMADMMSSWGKTDLSNGPRVPMFNFGMTGGESLLNGGSYPFFK